MTNQENKEHVIFAIIFGLAASFIVYIPLAMFNLSTWEAFYFHPMAYTFTAFFFFSLGALSNKK